MRTIKRKDCICDKMVIVDGQPGCGKTMLSPIVTSLDRVEKLSYSYELEHICGLNYLNKLTDDGAESMVKMITDLMLYNQMMSRDTNFRIDDMSSIFNDINPNRYIQRLIDKRKDVDVIDIIKETHPILNITTHNLLPLSKCIFKSMGDRTTFIEVVRHPLYMIRQQSLNMIRILNNPRHFTIYYDYDGMDFPIWEVGCEKEFLTANTPIEKAIITIKNMTNLYDKYREIYDVITIPFEDFVLHPYGYIMNIVEKLDSRITDDTYTMMKKQNVPRISHEDGIDLPVYRNLGWEPNKNKDNEMQFVKEGSSKEMFDIFKKLCTNYENKYKF